MATLYITEFQNIQAYPTTASAQAAKAPPVTDQTVAISGVSAQSAAFNAQTQIIRVHTDATCSILIGPNPTATTSKARLVADQTEYYGVNPTDKIAVITNV